MTLIEQVLTESVYGTLMTFARFGTAMIVMPGFGERGLPKNIRLVLALALSFALRLAVPGLPAGPPPALAGVVSDLAVETFAGFFIGAMARAILSALHFMGHLVSYVAGLANAFGGNGVGFDGSPMLSSFLTLSAVTVMFLSDVHHLAIEALIKSYTLIPYGELPPMGDFAEQYQRALTLSFNIGLSFAAPFLVMAVVIQVGLGFANRMMPNLPVFFVSMPLLSGGGIALLSIIAGGVLYSFVDVLAAWYMSLRL